MAYQSEAVLENEMMNRLADIGYERVKIQDDQALLRNFRRILNDNHINTWRRKCLIQ